MRFILLDDAAVELEEAVVWYDNRRTELGDRFLRASLAVFERITAHPFIGAPTRTARRIRIPGFPFSVIYRLSEDTLSVIAVAHDRRRPGYWRNR